MEIAPDGTRKKVLRYETLGEVTRSTTSNTLALRLAAASNGKASIRSRITFRTLAGEWDPSVLPMYKHSTQKHRRFMLKKHLLPRFGDRPLSEVTRQEIQATWLVSRRGIRASPSIDVRDMLRAVHSSGREWGHLQENRCARRRFADAGACVRDGR